MNKGYKTSITAPVKRLMKIDFSDDVTGLLNSGDQTGNYSNRPMYLLDFEEIPQETMSGRYSNENYDVIHFKATFVIRTRDYLRFVEELCSAKDHIYIDKSGQQHTYKHNQITVIGTDMRSVDFKSEEHGYYRYGDENVSQLELTCEYIFMRKGYEDIIPESVLDTLNGLDLYEDY